MIDPHPAADDAPRSASRLPIVLGVLVAAAVVVLDQATKQIAEHHLDLGQYVPLFGDAVGWQLVYNPGAAFGVPVPVWVLLIVTLLIVAIVARALPRTTSLLQATSYGLLLAGGLGNGIDRLLRPNRIGEVTGFFQGDVIDFVAWGSFPRFNVADSAITVGFVLLTVSLWLEERALQAAAESEAESESESA